MRNNLNKLKSLIAVFKVCMLVLSGIVGAGLASGKKL